MQIRFLGAAREVTGSCFLVDTGRLRFTVDCGMHQGGREAGPKNHAFPAFDPASLDFALVTHAHLDHCGLLPVLSSRAPALSIYTTRPTADLLPVMLLDSAHIQGREKSHATRRRAPAPVPPLYGVREVERAMRQVSGVPYGVEFRPHPDARVRFLDAGHILGSAIAEVRVRDGGHERRIVFSGDLGQPARPVVRDPENVALADVLVVESTYGNRLHKSMDDTVHELVGAVRDTLGNRRGNLIVPAFALGRAQELLILLFELCERGELEELNVFVDSPLARQATAVTLAHLESLDPVVGRFAQAMRRRRLPFRLRFTRTPEESIAINSIRSGAIVISASGMCEAGRIRHHLRHNLAREECGILFTGFQAGGTLGRRIVDGARSVQLFGETVPVRARIHTLGGLSAHADQRALLGWLSGFRRPPSRTYVVHGEEAAALDFAAAVESKLGWQVRVPGPGETADC
ncbi:MAG TPA: MBL fold metallo-hydrolase, partial [Usitatibacteraceae bacterium]|nr:MBL fold metallo-hydrolase [Usitatibacteraceae bacterium]